MDSESISRTELSKTIGVAMPTVMRIVDEFVKDGIVCEIGKGESSGGRKPMLLTANPKEIYFAGVVIDRNVHAVITNINGKVFGMSQQKVEYSGGITGVTDQLKECVSKAIQNSNLMPDNIAYLGIGTPGIGFQYSYTDNPIFDFWRTVNKDEFVQYAQMEFPLTLENTGKLGAVSELKFGRAKKYKNFIYVFAGEGISMGVVLDGKLQTGHQGVAGEFGHMTIDYNGPKCYCNNRGCLELYCSANALINEYENALHGSDKKRYTYYETPLHELLCAAEIGSEAARRAVKTGAKALGIGVGNLINLYNPQAIIMGGELCFLLDDFRETAIREAKKHIFRHEAQKVSFLEATIDYLEGPVGAACLAINQFVDEYCNG